MTPVTVTCVFVRGEYPYTPDYVTRLYAMVARWIDRPFRFVCLTDRPSLFFRPIETVTIARTTESAVWAKLELFHPDRRWRGRMLYLDLDVLIVASLAPIIDWPASFASTDDPSSGHRRMRVKDRFGRRIVRRVNSSVMVWDGGTHTELATGWTPAVADRLSGDQDWIGERLPGASSMPRAWFPRLSEIPAPPVPPDAKVVLVKVPKNHIAAAERPWVRELWGHACV